jgi:hypothetical protein
VAAIHALDSNTLRPTDRFAANAVGLPLLPGVLRRADVLSGRVEHALAFSAPATRSGVYVWPARRASGTSNPQLPPFGTRVRLRADYPETGLSSVVLAIVRGLTQYGMILSDRGSAWSVTTENSADRLSADLTPVQQMKGSDLEVVDVSSLMVHPDSGEARIFASGFESN